MDCLDRQTTITEDTIQADRQRTNTVHGTFTVKAATQAKACASGKHISPSTNAFLMTCLLLSRAANSESVAEDGVALAVGTRAWRSRSSRREHRPETSLGSEASTWRLAMHLRLSQCRHLVSLVLARSRALGTLRLHPCISAKTPLRCALRRRFLTNCTCLGRLVRSWARHMKVSRAWRRDPNLGAVPEAAPGGPVLSEVDVRRLVSARSWRLALVVRVVQGASLCAESPLRLGLRRGDAASAETRLLVQSFAIRTRARACLPYLPSTRSHAPTIASSFTELRSSM